MRILALLALFAGLVPLAAAAQTATPGVPKSFAPSICASPSPTPLAASVCVNDGNGGSPVMGTLNPSLHTFTLNGSAFSGTGALDAGTVLNRTLATRAQDAINIKDYAKCDTVSSSTGSIASGTATLGDASKSFTAADVGKYVELHQTGAGATPQLGRLVSFVDAHHVTLNITASNAVSPLYYTYGSDDTVAITTAAAAARATGKALSFPAGACWLATQTQSISLAGVTLLGTPVAVVQWPYIASGSILLISNTQTPAFSGLQGTRWDGLSVYYPGQDNTQATPVAFPPLFDDAYIVNFQVSNSKFFNPYVLVQSEAGTNGQASGRVAFDGNSLFCVSKCFNVLGGFADAISLGPTNIISSAVYGSDIPGTASLLAQWAQSNGEVFHIDLSNAAYKLLDEISAQVHLIHGYAYGVRILSGTLDLSNFSNINWDGVQTVLSVEGNAIVSTYNINGGEITSYNGDNLANAQPSLYFGSSSFGSVVSTTDVTFGLEQGSILYEDSNTLQRLAFNGNTIVSFGRSTVSGTYYAFHSANTQGVLTANNNQIQCAFAIGSTSIGVGIDERYASSTLVGNTLNNCYRQVQIGGTGTHTLSGNVTSGTTGDYAFSDITSSGALVIADGSNVFDKGTNKSHPSAVGSPTLHSAATPPVASGATACGTGAGAYSGSSDGAGAIQVGTGANGGACQLTFLQPHINSPSCVATWVNQSQLLPVTATPTSMTVRSAFGPGDTITYSCTFFQ